MACWARGAIKGVEGMDVFEVHQQLIDDYAVFTTGFVDIRDPRISETSLSAWSTGVSGRIPACR